MANFGSVSVGSVRVSGSLVLALAALCVFVLTAAAVAVVVAIKT
jgi:hypothetical protein